MSPKRPINRSRLHRNSSFLIPNPPQTTMRTPSKPISPPPLVGTDTPLRHRCGISDVESSRMASRRRKSCRPCTAPLPRECVNTLPPTRQRVSAAAVCPASAASERLAFEMTGTVAGDRRPSMGSFPIGAGHYSTQGGSHRARKSGLVYANKDVNIDLSTSMLPFPPRRSLQVVQPTVSHDGLASSPRRVRHKLVNVSLNSRLSECETTDGQHPSASHGTYPVNPALSGCKETSEVGLAIWMSSARLKYLYGCSGDDLCLSRMRRSTRDA